MSDYQPPFTLNDGILSLVAEIGESIGRLSVQQDLARELRLNRINRIRTVTGSLAIEGNTLSEAQITAILDGKPVIAPPREIQEAHNALAAYEQLLDWQPHREDDLLAAHQVLMKGLIERAGAYRSGGVGIMAGEKVLHMGPPANQLPRLMADLFHWLANNDIHPLIASSVFHYEFEFIHPFEDGNGRIGRLWQSLLLAQWKPLFANLPVESLVHRHQQAYYQAINQSTAESDCGAFIHFMLSMIRDALDDVAQFSATDQATDQDSDQATDQAGRLLKYCTEPRTSKEMMAFLGLSHRPHFRESLLTPLLASGQLTMTLPDRPKSPKQRYVATGVLKRDETD